jgi:DNA polymerase-3 subunit epsilon
MNGSTPPRAAQAPGFVRALIDAGVCFEPDERGWEAAARDIPARPAVVAIEDAHGRTLLLGTTADGRAFVQKRCAAPTDGSKRADLGGIARRAVCVPVASGFEADLAYLAMARERTPAAYRTLMARWGVWVVRMDYEDEFPEATPLTLEAASRHQPGRLMGPVSETWAPRVGEAVIDAFDLCRYPHILKQAPRGCACAYKEMGRCPAPCDGTETMASYRERVRRAVECVGQRGEERGAALLGEIKVAASESRFEDAAALKKVLERVKALDSSGLKGMTTMDRFRHVVVAPAGTPGAARVFCWVGGVLREVVEAMAADRHVFSRLVDETAGAAIGFAGTPAETEGVAVLTRWLTKGGAKRRARVIRVGGAGDMGEVMAAVRAVVRAGGGEDEVDETELGDRRADPA